MPASRRNGARSPSPSPASDYTYPGEPTNIDYFEVKGGASWTTGAWTLAVNDWWSPDNFQFFGQSNAIEGTVSYAFKGKLWNFFTPSISGQFGFQSYERMPTITPIGMLA